MANPSVTFTVTPTDFVRICNALTGGNQNAAAVKAVIVNYVEQAVLAYESQQAQQAALQNVAPPSPPPAIT